MNSQEQVSFSRYGKTFQEGLAALILEDRAFCDQIQEVLETEYFELKYLQVFVGKIFGYKKKYGVHPSPSIMATIVRSDLDGEDAAVQKQVRDFFIKVTTDGYEVDGAEYIKEISLEFCRKQKLKEAILKSIDLLQKSSFENISALINEAIKLGSDTNFGYDYKVDLPAREFRSRPAFNSKARSINLAT